MKFNYIVEALIKKFKPSSAETVAILPGGFKPPHRGHFSGLKYLLEEADKGIVFIGKRERDGFGITPEQSKQIWEIYKKYLNKPVEVYISERTPVVSTYEYADSHKNTNIIVGAGPGDEGRYNYFKQNIDQYPLVKVINIPPMHNRISASQIRGMLQRKDSNVFNYFLPEGITAKDKNTIAKILKFN